MCVHSVLMAVHDIVYIYFTMFIVFHSFVTQLWTDENARETRSCPKMFQVRLCARLQTLMYKGGPTSVEVL